MNKMKKKIIFFYYKCCRVKAGNGLCIKPTDSWQNNFEIKLITNKKVQKHLSENNISISINFFTRKTLFKSYLYLFE